MKILVVEDEQRLAELIARTFRAEHFETTVHHDGLIARDDAVTGSYDVIVLDRMLPGLDGLSIVREMRRQMVNTPVLMLTALGDLPDRVEGLGAGADDYLGKPFAFEELIARVKALSRRAQRPILPESIRLGSVEIDLTRHEIARDGSPIQLTPREFALLETLVRHKGQVLSRDQLLRRAWGPAADPGENVVDLYVHYLRKKLDPNGTDEPPIIRTVRGFGYILG